jgi:teichuronic acid biosynthesis glycosyltransferase TuaC
MDMPIRVLMVASEWPTPERPFDVPYLVRQVDYLRRAGIEVEVFSFRGARRPLNYLRAWRQLRRRLRARPFDLVHAQFGQSALLAWPKRVPLVITFHGCDLQGVKRPDGRLSLGGWFLVRLCQLMALQTDAVIIVSERMRRFLPASVTAHVIPTGLDFDQIPTMSCEEARRQLGLPLSQRLVLFVGDPAEPVKRHALAVSAVDILNQTCPATLVVGWRRPRREILVLMNACDALVVTSIQEGSPCVVKEALACNLPIVSLDVGDVPERVRGVAGCEVCADERPETIAAALVRTLERGGRTQGRDAVQALDETRLTAQVLDVYRNVLAGSAHQADRKGRHEQQTADAAFVHGVRVEPVRHGVSRAGLSDSPGTWR